MSTAEKQESTKAVFQIFIYEKETYNEAAIKQADIQTADREIVLSSVRSFLQFPEVGDTSQVEAQKSPTLKKASNRGRKPKPKHLDFDGQEPF